LEGIITFTEVRHAQGFTTPTPERREHLKHPQEIWTGISNLDSIRL
jgi:hypothetical protein